MYVIWSCTTYIFFLGLYGIKIMMTLIWDFFGHTKLVYSILFCDMYVFNLDFWHFFQCQCLLYNCITRTVIIVFMYFFLFLIIADAIHVCF